MVAVMLAACAALVLPAGSAATFPGGNGRIAYSTYADGQQEIFSINPDGSGETRLTNDPSYDRDPAWSPDGNQIAFTSGRTAQSDIHVMNADGSNVRRLTDDARSEVEPAWSPDGARIAFTRWTGDQSHLWTMDANGSHQLQLTSGAVRDSEPDWAPDGTRIAFVRTGLSGPYNIHVVRPDGTGVERLTAGDSDYEVDPTWSPDTLLLAYKDGAAGVTTMSPDGTGKQSLPNTSSDFYPEWAPEGTSLAVTTNSAIEVFSEIGSQRFTVTGDVNGIYGAPSWQPRPPPPAIPGYARPRSAGSVRVAMVPASAECAEPNRRHGPPLEFESCAPPVPTSPYLVPGPRFRGSVRLDAHRGDPSTVADEADVRVRVRVSNVVCKVSVPGACETGAMSDYVGELEGSFSLRITDRLNGHAQIHPATVTDMFQFPYTVPCAGGECDVDTTFNALVPGVIREGRRTIWQLGEAQLRDGGADGLATSDDYSLFATQGVFVP